MISFDIKVNGLDDLLKDADRAAGQMPQLLKQAMAKSVTMVKNTAREIRPSSFKNQTGNLRRSITGEVMSAAKGRVYVQSSAPYGAAVEAGSRPHTIVPKGRFLAFRIGGKMVFAKRVNHPGSRPYPYMEPAYRENTPRIVEEYAKLGTQIVKVLAGK